MTPDEKNMLRRARIVGSGIFIAVGFGTLIIGALWEKETLIGLGVVLVLVYSFKLLRTHAWP